MSKPFRERNPVPIGAISIAVLIALLAIAFNVNKLPLVGGGDTRELREDGRHDAKGTLVPPSPNDSDISRRGGRFRARRHRVRAAADHEISRFYVDTVTGHFVSIAAAHECESVSGG